MNSTSGTLIVLLALTTLGGGAWAWKEYQEIVQLRANADALNLSNADLQKRLEESEKSNKRLSDVIAALRGQAGRDGDVADASNPSDTPGPRRNGGGFRAMLNNPQFQKLMGVQQKAMLDNTYAHLFKTLNLSPQQLDQFKDLLVQKQQAVMDAMQAARDQGINPRTDPDDFQQAITQAQAAVDSQIQAELGDAGFAQYQQYQQTLPQRTVANQLQQSLSYSSTPLTDDQANQLIQILAQTAPASSGNGGNGFFAAGGGMAFMGGGGGIGQITDQAISQAQGILSAPQIQALQQLQQQQQARQQMQQLMRAGRGGGG